MTTVPGLAIGASFSPDAKQIAYSSTVTGGLKFMCGRQPTRFERQITTDGKQAMEPAWSPDGNGSRTSGAAWSVGDSGRWRHGETGQRLRIESRVVSGWQATRHPIVRPSSLAASDWPGDGESTIWMVAADGSNLQQLTQPRVPPGQHADPSWSPDGRQVIFATLGIVTMGFRGALFTVDAKSGEIKPVSVGGLWGAANPVYAPDGKGVYFAGRPQIGGASGVYYVAFSGDPRAVDLCPTKQAAPSRITVARDGKSLAFTRMVNSGQIWLTDGDGKDNRPLYQDLVVRARLPNYSPDGTRLTFQVQSDDATLGIWLMNADGSNPTRVAPDLGNSNGASWNAEGTGLLLNLFSRNKLSFVWVNLADGSHKPVFESAENVTRTHLTPDGKDLVYDYGSPRNIWKRPAAGGLPKQLTFGRQRNWFPEVSWDGKWIVYESPTATKRKSP